MSVMRFDVRASLNLTQADISRAVRRGQYILDNQVVKDSNYFIPKDTGNAEGSGIRATAFGEGRVTWNTPYIRRIYYGTNFNFSKDINPNAQALWFEAAKSRHLSEWIEITKRAINL